MSGYVRSILMGDPAHFRIRGGANPHTRNFLGMKKSVNGKLALRQWHGLAKLLTELGVRIFVLPAREESPGMVFPANAGYLTNTFDAIPLARKTFYLSRSIPTRAAEAKVYSDFVSRLGFSVREMENRFEGEADFIETRDMCLFTSGKLEEQRFEFRFGFPPYKRIYGFRSDPKALAEVQALSVEKPVLPLTLTRETHYHGDTCLCAFGPKREFLMAYLPAISEKTGQLLKDRFKERLLPLDKQDGEYFSANSFQVDGNEPVLVMPNTATPRLRAQIQERGVRTVTADVSEFMEKGGGSVKCMIGDLGPLAAGGVSPEVQQFRQSRSYEVLFGN